MKHILFVCSANKDRSPTAEDHFAQVYPELEFASAGTNIKICRQLGTTEVEEGLLEQADRILCMESKHKKAISAMFGDGFNSKIEVLNIRDHYKYGDAELISLLEKKISFR